MAGRIRDEDIAAVRERTRIDEVVSQHVTLRPAGGGSLKGLCPFHDERTPSFHVTPARNLWFCFGCGAGGDVISFLQQVEALSFAEAVERLAERAGVQLRRVEGGSSPRAEPGQRSRLIDGNRAATEFYREQLTDSTEGAPGRQFLAERGFDQAAAEVFEVGYAPRDGDRLLSHLRARGFRDAELVKAGLVAQGARGAYDRFRGRLVWPIRDLSGDVVGFGARRLYDDDRVEAKYLNTPETPIYRKSQVLYGLAGARAEIARREQAVIVEGYTDVMACHLAGVPTAVATCGTSFGNDHVRVLRRVLHDDRWYRSELIFTFDGDEAGHRAARRVFAEDKEFVSQAYVAIEPNGLDPCDLRLRHGDAAVRELVARRAPIYRFVLRSLLQPYDLDRADSRVDALRAAAPLVAHIRDRSKVEAYARELAGLLGMSDEIAAVRAEVLGARRGNGTAARGRGVEPARGRGEAVGGGAEPDRGGADGTRGGAEPAGPPGGSGPDLRDPRFGVEREVLKVALQSPTLVGPPFDALDDDDFTHPGYAAVRRAIEAAGGAGTAVPGEAWVTAVRDRAGNEEVRALTTALAVEPARSDTEQDRRYAEALVAKAQELTVRRRVDDLKGRLQRTSPVDHQERYNRLFGELVALEQQRRGLRERAIGGGL